MRPPRLTTFSDPDSNSDDDHEGIPGANFISVADTTSESEDEQNAGSYRRPGVRPGYRSLRDSRRDVFRPLRRTRSIGECSATPDEGDDEGEEACITVGESECPQHIMSYCFIANDRGCVV